MEDNNNNNNSITREDELTAEEVNTNKVLRNTLGNFTHENWNRIKSSRRPEGRHLVLPLKGKPIARSLLQEFNNAEEYNPALNKAFIENNNSNLNNAYPGPKVAGVKRKEPNNGFNNTLKPPAKKSARRKVGGKRKTRKAKKSRKH